MKLPYWWNMERSLSLPEGSSKTSTSTSPKNALCQVWLKLVQWFWRRRWKCEKFMTTTTTTTTTTDKLRSEKLAWAFSSGELKKWKVYDNNYYKDNRHIVIRESLFGFCSGELKCCSRDKPQHPSKNISYSRLNKHITSSYWHLCR